MFNEKEILCNCVEQYINIANKNNNKLSDYFCIISFLNILKEQYPSYSKDFNRYLNFFDTAGILKKYKKDDIVYSTYKLYGISPDVANDIKMGFVDGCSSRYINFMIAIAICGKPTNAHSRYILQDIYSWNYTAFAKQKIYYIELYLKMGLDPNLFINKIVSRREIKKIHLSLLYSRLGDSYNKIHMFEKAETYYKKAVKLDDYYYKKIISFYKQNKKTKKMVDYLTNEKKLYFFNKERKKKIYEYLKQLNIY